MRFNLPHPLTSNRQLLHSGHGRRWIDRRPTRHADQGGASSSSVPAESQSAERSETTSGLLAGAGEQSSGGSSHDANASDSQAQPDGATQAASTQASGAQSQAAERHEPVPGRAGETAGPREPRPVARIAMWSGPRNISTAMMRSFGNRSDTDVCDEPFYACYLQATGHQHPISAEIIEAHESRWDAVVESLTGPSPTGKPVWYQKQMAHHMLPGESMDWIENPEFQHLFLVRRPEAMLLSLGKVIGEMTIEQTGLPQQLEILHRVKQHTGVAPVVVDSRQVLDDPPGALRQICSRLGIEFQTSMLTWPQGPRDTDGVWGPHWYGRLYETTGFAQEIVRDEPLPRAAAEILAACNDIYDELMQYRLGTQ